MSSAHPQLAIIEAADDRRQVRHEARMRPGQSCYLGTLVDVVDMSMIYLYYLSSRLVSDVCRCLEWRVKLSNCQTFCKHYFYMFVYRVVIRGHLYTGDLELRDGTRDTHVSVTGV